jgi:hypothetical protein
MKPKDDTLPLAVCLLIPPPHFTCVCSFCLFHNLYYDFFWFLSTTSIEGRAGAANNVELLALQKRARHDERVKREQQRNEHVRTSSRLSRSTHVVNNQPRAAAHQQSMTSTPNPSLSSSSTSSVEPTRRAHLRATIHPSSRAAVATMTSSSSSSPTTVTEVATTTRHEDSFNARNAHRLTILPRRPNSLILRPQLEHALPSSTSSSSSSTSKSSLLNGIGWCTSIPHVLRDRQSGVYPMLTSARGPISYHQRLIESLPQQLHRQSLAIEPPLSSLSTPVTPQFGGDGGLCWDSSQHILHIAGRCHSRGAITRLKFSRHFIGPAASLHFNDRDINEQKPEQPSIMNAVDEQCLSEDDEGQNKRDGYGSIRCDILSQRMVDQQMTCFKRLTQTPMSTSAENNAHALGIPPSTTIHDDNGAMYIEAYSGEGVVLRDPCTICCCTRVASN